MIVWNPANVTILKRHVGAGLRPDEIAQAMGSTRGAVLSALSRNRLTTIVTNSHREAALRLAGEGWSPSRIGVRIGLQPGQVERILARERHRENA